MQNELDDTDLLEQQLLNDIYEFDIQQQDNNTGSNNYSHQLHQLSDNDINFNLICSHESSESEATITNLDDITKSSCDENTVKEKETEKEDSDSSDEEDEDDWENSLIYVPAGN
jgi:hypothetical protein